VNPWLLSLALAAEPTPPPAPAPVDAVFPDDWLGTWTGACRANPHLHGTRLYELTLVLVRRTDGPGYRMRLVGRQDGVVERMDATLSPGTSPVHLVRDDGDGLLVDVWRQGSALLLHTEKGGERRFESLRIDGDGLLQRDVVVFGGGEVRRSVTDAAVARSYPLERSERCTLTRRPRPPKADAPAAEAAPAAP